MPPQWAAFSTLEPWAYRYHPRMSSADHKLLKGKKGQYQRRLKEARIGDIQAQYEVGIMLANGEGVDKDVVEARVWFESAAKRGHTGAQYLLGMAYAGGVGAERNEWLALRWLLKAFEQGNAKAAPKLARLLEKARAQMARQCWRELADAGMPEAQLAVAMQYQSDAEDTDPQALAEAAQWFQRAAEQGLAQAQHALGLMYASGAGVERDLSLARELLGAAAAQGMASAAVELAALPPEDTPSDEPDNVAPAPTARPRKLPQGQAKRLGEFAKGSTPDNQYHLGMMLERGFGVARDVDEAEKWYRAAAGQGHAGAQYALAQLTADADPFGAAQWYRQAAEQGHADAQVAYARVVALGLGVPVDALTAHAWYVRAAAQDHPVALAEVARVLEPTDKPLAMTCWERAASAGLSQAQWRVGEAALAGDGCSLDSAAAAHWLQLAAERGHAQAQHRLGGLYAQGLGVERDWAVAEHWYTQAMEQGVAEAQWALGQLLVTGGPGLPGDVQRATVLCRRAAAKGHAPAQATMGNLMAQAGQSARAVSWWLQAAEQGDPEAAYNLALAYWQGKGVNQDPAQGFRWMLLPASHGIAAAQARLGYAYAAGDGVAVDLIEATRWWMLAATHGNTDAKANLERAQGILAPSQWAEAQRRADAWRPVA